MKNSTYYYELDNFPVLNYCSEEMVGDINECDFFNCLKCGNI